MNTGHIVGGGLGVMVGVVLSSLLSKYTSIHLTDSDAALTGSALLAAGIAVGHGIYSHGIVGIFTEVWRGQKK